MDNKKSAPAKGKTAINQFEMGDTQPKASMTEQASSPKSGTQAFNISMFDNDDLSLPKGNL